MSLTPVTLRNAADTWVNENRASENFSGSTRLRLDATSNFAKYAFIYFSRPFQLGATITSAHLKLYSDASAGNWSATSRTITATRVTSGWKVGRLTFNTIPGFTSGSTAADAVSVTKSTAITDGTLWDFDLTTMMQAVSDGTPWYGVRLSINESTMRKLYSAQASQFKPVFEISWSWAPSAPSTLSPSGGRSVSVAYPTLRFDFTDTAGNTTMQAAQVQVDSTPTWTNPYLDTGPIFTTIPQLDLSVESVSLLSNGTFDTNITGWSNVTNSTPTRVTTPVQAGAGALQMSSIAAGNMEVGTASGTSGTAVVGGQTYSAQGYVRTASLARTTVMLIDWYDTTGTLISTSTGTSSADSTTYATRVVTATAPATAKYARVRYQVQSTAAASEIHYLDEVTFATGSGTGGGTAPGVYGGLVDGGSAYWRVKVQDASGKWSDWSDPALMSRTSKGTLTITNPPVGATVTEATPPIVWTFTGRTQRMYQVIIKDAQGATLYDSGKVTSTTTSHSLPKNIVTSTTKTYTAIVRVWDTVDRERTPGDPMSVEASRDFTYALSAGVTAVTALTGTDLTPVPAMQLNWTRTSAPDSYTIVRDGVVIDAGVLPGDVIVSGTSYRYTDRGAAPQRSHTWEVRSVVNGVTSTSNPTVTATLKPVGIWLQDPDSGTTVQLLGADEGSWSMGEEAEIYTPIGAQRPIRVTQALRGYEGSLSGLLVADSLGTLQQKEANMLALKAAPGRTYQLTLSDLSFAVVIGNVAITPTPRGEIDRMVSFDFWQVDNFTFTPVL